MGFFRKRFLIILCASLLAVFLVFSNPAPRESHAATATAVLIAAIKLATKVLTEQITKAFEGLIQSIGETIMDYFLPFLETMWEDYATEERMAEIEAVGQESEAAQAEAQMDYMTQIELDRLRDSLDAKISKGECRIVTASALGSISEIATKVWESYFNEEIRKDQTFVEGSLYDKGPIAASKRLREERFQKYCSTDEHLGNLAGICTNTNQERIDKDKATHMITSCNTIKKGDHEAVLQMIRYLNPPPGLTPLPKAVKTDTLVQGAYLDRTIATARNDPYKAFLVKQVSRHMEPTDCPTVPGTNVDAKRYVEAIDQRLNRPRVQNRPCPSEAELECYVHKYALQDPSFISDCNEGEKQIERCMLGINALRTQLTYDSGSLRDFQLLMNVVDQSGSRAIISPPIDSMGRQ